MTATKYALVPVQPDEWMFRAGKRHALWPAATWYAMLAAAPKELPEEVVERVAEALKEPIFHVFIRNMAWEDIPNLNKENYREVARAALLAVMGGE